MDSHDYFYNELVIISNTVLLKEKRTENKDLSAPNQKSQGKHRSKPQPKRSRKATFPLGRQVHAKYGRDWKTHPARLSLKEIYP